MIHSNKFLETAEGPECLKCIVNNSLLELHFSKLVPLFLEGWITLSPFYLLQTSLEARRCQLKNLFLGCTYIIFFLASLDHIV